jgi:hypothetical protein
LLKSRFDFSIKEKLLEIFQVSLFRLSKRFVDEAHSCSGGMANIERRRVVPTFVLISNLKKQRFFLLF